MIIWGSGLYGKVDEVPRLFHVATNFGHLYYIPLIPLGSYVVLSESEGSFRGVQVPLNGKSIVIAWLRALLVVGAVGAVIAGIVQMSEQHTTEAVVFWVMAASAIAAMIYSKKAHGINRVSYERALHLADLLSVTEEARLMIEVAYGQMTAEQAAARLAGEQQTPLSEQDSGARV